MEGKRLGVVVGGLHWKTGAVAQHLTEVFRFFRFAVPEEGALAWQYTRDVNYEQPGPLRPTVEAWLASPNGQFALSQLGRALT
jgi:hypothetical protein